MGGPYGYQDVPIVKALVVVVIRWKEDTHSGRDVSWSDVDDRERVDGRPVPSLAQTPPSRAFFAIAAVPSIESTWKVVVGIGSACAVVLCALEVLNDDLGTIWASARSHRVCSCRRRDVRDGGWTQLREGRRKGGKGCFEQKEAGQVVCITSRPQ
ncbi:hypothetical protein BDN70DRAFT_889196, partial [Pholiota conissans]